MKVYVLVESSFDEEYPSEHGDININVFAKKKDAVQYREKKIKEEFGDEISYNTIINKNSDYIEIENGSQYFGFEMRTKKIN